MTPPVRWIKIPVCENYSFETDKLNMNYSHLVKKFCIVLPSFLLFAGLSMFLVLPVQVGAITLPGGGSGAGVSPSFEATQKAALSLINAAVSKLDAAESKIQNNVS